MGGMRIGAGGPQRGSAGSGLGARRSEWVARGVELLVACTHMGGTATDPLGPPRPRPETDTETAKLRRRQRESGGARHIERAGT